jgi:hypothetical protein
VRTRIALEATAADVKHVEAAQLGVLRRRELTHLPLWQVRTRIALEATTAADVKQHVEAPQLVSPRCREPTHQQYVTERSTLTNQLRIADLDHRLLHVVARTLVLLRTTVARAAAMSMIFHRVLYRLEAGLAGRLRERLNAPVDR